MASQIIPSDTDGSNDSNPATETVSHPGKLENDDRPIMTLLQRLIGIVPHEDTILTNAQIVEILQKEFQFDISNLHELQIDIFISVTKKFLKDWPQWDEFDQVIITLKAQNDNGSIKAILDVKYKELKDYLKVMLDIAKELSRQTIADLQASEALKSEKVNLNDVVLDVYCTRQQLNELIYKYPHPSFKDTVFNINSVAPSRISLNKPSYISVLNWFDIRFNISLSTLIVNRETIHELKHVLVNKKLNAATKHPKLNTCLQKKNQMSQGSLVSVEKVLSVFARAIAKHKETDTGIAPLLTLLYETVKVDLQNVKNIRLQNIYRRSLNSYSYVRQLYKDVELEDHENANKYDLHIEETINPMIKFFIGKADLVAKPGFIVPLELQVRIECKLCQLKFSSHPAMQQMMTHVLECHFNEPDVRCSNCRKVFSLVQLSHDCWRHDC